MKKYFLFISVAATAILIFFACKKENNSSNNNNNSPSTTAVIQPNPTYGTLELTSVVSMGYGSNPTAYSYYGEAQFAIGIDGGPVSVDGIPFAHPGMSYTFAPQNGQPSNTVNWSLVGFNFTAKPLPILTSQMLFDSVHRNKPYAIKGVVANLNSYDSVGVIISSSCGSSQLGYGFPTINGDSIKFDSYNVNLATISCPANTHPLVYLQFNLVNYKDTIVGVNKYHFSSRKIFISHANLTN